MAEAPEMQLNGPVHLVLYELQQHPAVNVLYNLTAEQNFSLLVKQFRGGQMQTPHDVLAGMMGVFDLACRLHAQDQEVLSQINTLFHTFQSCWAREGLPTKDAAPAPAPTPVQPPQAPPRPHQEETPKRDVLGGGHGDTALVARHSDAAGRDGRASPHAKAETTGTTTGVMRMEEDGIYGDADVGFAADGQPLTGVQRAARLVGAVGQIADAAEEMMDKVRQMAAMDAEAQQEAQQLAASTSPTGKLASAVQQLRAAEGDVVAAQHAAERAAAKLHALEAQAAANHEASRQSIRQGQGARAAINALPAPVAPPLSQHAYAVAHHLLQVRPPAVMSMAAAVGAGGDHMDVCEAIRSLLAGATAETVVIKKEATPAVATQ